MVTESLAFIAAVAVMSALWFFSQMISTRHGSRTVDEASELLSTRAIAQTIATQQEKIDSLNTEILQMQRVIVDLQARLERALEQIRRLESDLKRVTDERDVLQRMARGLSISDSTVHVAHDIAGGDVSIGRDETQAGHDATKEGEK